MKIKSIRGNKHRLDCIRHFVSGYIVFHHSPYAIGPVLACYATTPTAQMPPSYLHPSISNVQKRIQLEPVHNDIDDKSMDFI